MGQQVCLKPGLVKCRLTEGLGDGRADAGSAAFDPTGLSGVVFRFQGLTPWAELTGEREFGTLRGVPAVGG